MVRVAMGNHHEIQFLEIHSERVHVLREYFGVIARIEQNPLPAIFHERRKAPVHSYFRGFSEGIVENGNPSGGVRRGRGRSQESQAKHQTESHLDSHGFLPEFPTLTLLLRRIIRRLPGRVKLRTLIPTSAGTSGSN